MVQAHHQLQENGRGLTLPSAAFYWAFGEFAEAEKYIQKEPDDHNRAIFTGVSEYLKGNLSAARKSFALAHLSRTRSGVCRLHGNRAGSPTGFVVVSYCPAISARQNGPQRAPGVSRQLPELRNSGAKGNFGAQSRRWDEANMCTNSHEEH